MENSERLLVDSELLLKNGRFASAYALAVLGLEEIGKAVLQKWSEVDDKLEVPRGISFHIQKQSAVAHLLTAPLAIHHVVEEILIPNLPTFLSGKLDKDDFIEGLAKKMWESEEGRWSQHSELGVFDVLKQISIYDDGSKYAGDVRSSDFCADSVCEMIEKARRAVPLIDHKLAMSIARATFDISARKTNRHRS